MIRRAALPLVLPALSRSALSWPALSWPALLWSALSWPALFAGCAMPLTDGLSSDDSQAAALRQLEAETGSPWLARWHSDVRTPALLEGRTAPVMSLSSGKPGAAANAAKGFFAAHAALYQLEAPAEQLVVTRSDEDELGMAHVRLRQQRGGVPVWGLGLGVHFDRGGALVRIEGRCAPLLGPDDLSPTITTDEARDAAVRTVAAARAGAADRQAAPIADSSILIAEAPELVIDAAPPEAPTGDGAPSMSATTAAASARAIPARLAWRVEVVVEDAAHPARLEAFVDAATREAYRVTDILDDLKGSGAGVFGERQALDVTERRGHYFLEDAAAGKPAQKIYTARNATRLPGSEVTSASRDRWDEVQTGSGAAVDAAAYVAATHRYYERVHGRRGALGKGAGMRATVHYGQGFANAFWSGKQLVFGDGEPGKTAPLAGALDVVAHEFTHAVSQASASLGHSGEPGALNEAVSDVFACFVEHQARDGSGNWRIGEDVLLGDGARRHGMRDLADPHSTHDPAHTSEARRGVDDRGGVHVNSTIAGHAAFLMTEGGRNLVSSVRVDGIGRAEAERIWYRALTRYLGPWSAFREAAEATVAAARDLHGAGSAELRSVTAAWQAVGVLPQ